MTTAFVFPGQGSQSVGMLADVAAEFSQVHETFAEASEALGYDLWAAVEGGETLNQTAVTQPAMLAAGLAMYRILKAEGKADNLSFMAGHSLGEYTALTASGVFMPKDAFALVRARGEFMQSAVPEGVGAMAAILGLTDEQVRDCCAHTAAADDIVSAVNYNSPGQVVIAGNKAAVERAMDCCKQAGAKRALPLPVSVPSHCALMKPAAEQLAQMLASVQLSVPSVGVVNNVDVRVESDASSIKSALVKQLYSPVRWVETVQWLKSQGVTRIVEVGPGKVLAGLIKRTDGDIENFAVADLKTLRDYCAQ